MRFQWKFSQKRNLNSLTLILILSIPEVFKINQEIKVEKSYFQITHNMVVHFPIAFATGASIFEILSFFRPYYSSSAKIMIGLTSASSLISFITGQKAEENIMRTEKGKEKKDFVEIHGAIGITLLFISTLAFIFKFFPQMKIISAILIFLSFALASTCGYFGGIISHK
jgi:uncharacterized membrane protein